VLLTIGATILVIGVLIFVHELGHFMAAKAVGIGVHRFSLGLGPVTPLSFRRGETEYVISWIPFGGYVKMASKEEQEEAMGALEGGTGVTPFPPQKLFENKPLWARIMVISAGVTMNFVFAWAVYFGLATTYGRIEDPTTTIARIDSTELPEAAAALRGLENLEFLRINGDTITSWNDVRNHIADPTSEQLVFEFSGMEPIGVLIDGFAMDDRVALYMSLDPKEEARIGLVAASSPAAEAGFEEGDLVIRAGQEVIEHWDAMVDVVQRSANQTVEFLVLRGDSEVVLSAVPRLITQEDPETGEEEEIGQLGVNRQLRHIRIGIIAGVGEGWRGAVTDARFILAMLDGLFRGRVSPRELGGPVLIGQISGQVAAQGMIPLLRFMALFSINLAILNLLPIPVLDGGQLVFLLIEGVRGKPVPVAVRIRFSQFGMVILLGILALAMTNDLLRVFGM
jgi:regulator of sigma E protease